MRAPTTRAAARFAHKVARQWMKGPPRPMPKHWRAVCLAALAVDLLPVLRTHARPTGAR